MATPRGRPQGQGGRPFRVAVMAKTPRPSTEEHLPASTAGGFGHSAPPACRHDNPSIARPEFPHSPQRRRAAPDIRDVSRGNARRSAANTCVRRSGHMTSHRIRNKLLTVCGGRRRSLILSSTILDGEDTRLTNDPGKGRRPASSLSGLESHVAGRHYHYREGRRGDLE